MQLFCLHRNIYKLACYALRQENLSKTAERLKNLLGNWDTLKSNKVPDKDIAKVTGISRSTYYRRKRLIRLYGISSLENKSKIPHRKRQSKIPESVINTICDIRKENPTYGKSKIVVILLRDYKITISESSVGRILKKLLEGNKIEKSLSYVRAKQKRRFNNHAKRWNYGIKPNNPGEMVQIDHMTVSKLPAAYAAGISLLRTSFVLHLLFLDSQYIV